MSFETDKRAVTSFEYGLIAAIIVVTVLLGFNSMGSSVQKRFNNVAAHLT